MNVPWAPELRVSIVCETINWSPIFLVAAFFLFFAFAAGREIENETGGERKN